MNLHYVSPEKHVPSGLSGTMKLCLSVIIALCTLTSSTPTFAQSPEVRKAFRFIDIEQPSKGLSALEQLVKGDPENSSYLYYWGLAQLRSGVKDKALENFEKGIALDKKNGLNYAGIGHVRLLEKNPTEAKVQLEKALDVSKSKNVEVLRAVAEAYLTDTKYLLDAINVLNKAKSINSTDPEINLLLGDALLIQSPQQGGPAINSYERAAASDPKSGKAHYKIGKLWQKARANDIAIASFEKAIAADPEYAPAYKDLGETYYVQKEYGKAVSMYEKYLGISENPGQAKYQYAFFLFMAKDYEKANSIFKEVISNPDVSPIALRYYAYSLIEQSKNEPEGGAKGEEARKALERYFQKAKPEDIQASDYTYFGKLLLKSGQDSLANMNFEKSIAMDSTQTEAAELMAESYFKNKKYDKAIDAYTILVETREKPLMSELFNLGRSYYYNLQFPQADSIFTLVAEKTPNMTVGPLWAAKARQQIDSTGALGLANPMFEAVIEKGSENPEKYKKDLIEAYEYLGSYYINIKPDVARAKTYYEKILELDPSHVQAKEVMKALKQG
jgi:tetratricopeptide (TPR) repeat protein